MDPKSKAILYLSITCAILIGILLYVLRKSDNVALQVEVAAQKALVKELQTVNDSLKSGESSIINDIDSVDTDIASAETGDAEVKYIYRDAKINLFTLSSDSNFMLFADNLSKADSLKW